MHAVLRCFEEEASRTNNELRAEVKRLRSNASNILQQGDQASVVLENQNQFLLNNFRQAQEEEEEEEEE